MAQWNSNFLLSKCFICVDGSMLASYFITEISKFKILSWPCKVFIALLGRLFEVFSVFLRITGRKNEATDLVVSPLWGSTIDIISAHVPGQHMWASAGQGMRALAIVHIVQTSGSQMVMLRFITLSARDHHWPNPREKKLWREQQYKSARVSALTGSVPSKMLENGPGAAEGFSSLLGSKSSCPTLCYSL